MLAGLRFSSSAKASAGGRRQTEEKDTRGKSREAGGPISGSATRHQTVEHKEEDGGQTNAPPLRIRDLSKQQLAKVAAEKTRQQEANGDVLCTQGEKSESTSLVESAATGYCTTSPAPLSGVGDRRNADLNGSTAENSLPVVHARELNPFLRNQYLSKQRQEEGSPVAAESGLPSALASCPSVSDSLTSRGARTWRSRQLRRLQERAAERGEAVSSLIEDHITGRNAEGQDAHIWNDLLFGPRGDHNEDASLPSRRTDRGSSGNRRGDSRFPVRDDNNGDGDRDSPPAEGTSKGRGAGDVASFGPGWFPERRRTSWRREQMPRQDQGYEKGRDEDSPAKSRAGDLEGPRSAGGRTDPGFSEAEHGRGTQFRVDRVQRMRGSQTSAGVAGEPRFDFLGARSKLKTKESRHSGSADRERAEVSVFDQSGKEGDSLKTWQRPRIPDFHRNQRATSPSTHLSSSTAPVTSTSHIPSAVRPSSDSSCSDNSTVVHSSKCVQNLADCDVNTLAAQVLKAQLAGDRDTCRRLGGLLASRQLSASEDDLVREGARVDHRDAGTRRGSGASVAQPTDSPSRLPSSSVPGSQGEAGVSIAELARRERVSHQGNEYDEAYKDALLKRRSGANSDDDFEGELPSKKLSAKRQRLAEERAKARARTLNNKQGHCIRCLDSSGFERTYGDGVIAVSTHALLCFVPWRFCVFRTHLLILPVAHTGALTALDDSGYEEIRNFQKSLVAFFETQNKVPVFIETVSRFVSKERNWMGGGPHTAVEVLPIELDRLSEAKTFFRKAFDEVEGEWQQNKKVIEVRGREGVRRAIPANFPYIHVDFGLGGGLAHVIEDGRAFPSNFGQEVILGMHELCSTDRAFPTSQYVPASSGIERLQ
ncbi:protein cwfj c-terminus 1 family protein [Cystoisospora suis]|uniref:Protein cwfj c-terminus 1 family protein n=1 Tax=Cystoisospora suis TaxID=483139 RepID=A0A2C6KMC0_9APIC|nr:protein cwfj c-terminus 1 family protein [Cystoisospora suis]